MDDALAVRGVERVGDFDCEIEERIQFERPAPDVVVERNTLHEFHHNEGAAFEIAEVMDGADIGMIESRCRLRFESKTVQTQRIARHFFRKKF